MCVRLRKDLAGAPPTRRDAVEGTLRGLPQSGPGGRGAGRSPRSQRAPRVVGAAWQAGMARMAGPRLLGCGPPLVDSKVRPFKDPRAGAPHPPALTG